MIQRLGGGKGLVRLFRHSNRGYNKRNNWVMGRG